MDKPKTKIILLILFALFFKLGFEIVYSIADTTKFEFVEADCKSGLENEIDDEVTLDGIRNQHIVPNLNIQSIINLTISVNTRQLTDLNTPPPERAISKSFILTPSP